MSIGQYPQDVPQQEPIAVIYKLSEGYVLMVRGRTIACPSIHALGQAITKQVKAVEQEPPLVVQGPEVPPVGPVMSEAQASDWLEAALHPEPQQPFASPDQNAFYQRNNLVQSVRGLVEGKITEDQFALARRQFFPDLDDAMVLNIAQSMGWASTRVTSTSYSPGVFRDPGLREAEALRGIGLPRSWESVLSPEPPDPGDDDDEDGLEPEISLDMPVQVVDLAAGREGRRAARAQHQQQLWPEEPMPEPKAKPKRGRRKA